jgi:glucose-6-phosphate isomerase
MALLSIWNSNKLGYRSHAIIPYDDGLKKFPDYLQQLMMESNGKRVNIAGETLNHLTSPIIWGGVGCNGQHAYMQLLHQGTDVIPVDFLIAAKPHSYSLDHNTNAKNKNDPLFSHKICPGNRPSNTLMYPSLTPEILGSLVALYEHIVFVQSIMWGINAFDQYGVELGKQVVKQILPCLEKDAKNSLDEQGLDSSTVGLIKYFYQF